MKIHRNIHPAFIISLTSVQTVFFKSLLILSMVILIVPVLQGCNEHPQDGDFTEACDRPSVKVAVRKLSTAETRAVDAYVFNDDALQRLDCYQSMDDIPENEVLIGSCSGRKILLLCANPQYGKDSWKEYNSFKKARTMKVNLEDENRQFPVMAAYSYFSTGHNTDIELERISSEIELQSIRCNFSGKPYEGEIITDAKAYLINVNATCSLLPEGEEHVERIINHGGLIEQDVDNFKDKTTILCEIGNIGTEYLDPSCNLLCYANSSTEESIGTPFTRLVIEGKIQGQTWYWSIDINQEKYNTGIERNCKYIFNITIRSKGTKNPNIPITPNMVETTFKTEKWKEKEAYYVSF